MPTPNHRLGKEVDVDFLVFVERYATDLLRWDILTFFGQNPDFCGTPMQVAQKLGRSLQVVRPEVGDLAIQGILEQSNAQDGQVRYQLTRVPDIQRLVLKLAGSPLAK
jgi:hypothetical protein